MKVYLVELMRYNSWGEILNCLILKCYKNRACANHYLIEEALRYVRFDFDVSIVNDGVYINTVKAERKNTKVMEEEIVEIRVIEKEVK